MSEAEGLVRWAAAVEYLGTAGNGWQSQADDSGIADYLTGALQRICPWTGTLVAAGRTDAGVHACGQIVHLDLPAERDEKAWLLGLNSVLPHDIRILWLRRVDDSFHARFSATRRSYLYLLCNNPVLSAFRRGRMAWERKPLDEQAMQNAADTLVGEKDFASFRSARCSARHSVRDLQRLQICRTDDVLGFEIVANAFLHNMCRVLIGSLWKVGLGQWLPEKIPQILQAADRTQAGRTAPAEGLYFLGPDYPPQYRLPGCVSAQGLMAGTAAHSGTKIPQR